MAKTLLISAALIIIIILLIIIAVKPPTTMTTKPAEQPIILQPTPRAPEPQIPTPTTPTPRAPEITPTPAGIEIEKVYPQEVTFWVNEIRVPETTDYYGAGFIPIKEDQLKTFAGSFGPYFEDPTLHIKVVLCAELYKVQAAPACEIVPIIYRDNYVSFARGYQFDEYIGGSAAKDYIAYYDVFVGNTAIAKSNKAVIRTVKD